MPFAAGEGARLYWRLEGPADKPTLVLLHALGTDMTVWDGVVPFLVPRFQLLRFDLRGHGASDAPSGDYTLPLLARDVADVMRAAQTARAAVVGLSIGGMIAMETALRFPEQVSALVLICTSASVDRQLWVDRVKTVESEGIGSVADAALGRFLSPQFADAHPDRVAALRRTLLDTAGYAGAAASIRDADLRERIASIKVSTLVIGSERDVSMPFSPHSEILLASIPGSSSVKVDAGHLAPIEVPQAIGQAVATFLQTGFDTRSAAAVLYEAGLDNRRRILGDAWVDRSLAQSTSFDSAFQEMITRIAWWEIWGRTGLDERTRRLLVLAVTASLGRWEEFSLHVRAGLMQGGFSRDDLKEALMQIAIYAGIPAANTAFARARIIIADLDV
jgi:3-oxoadipate enol-lactonase/4-carboxymuconolactone decarboxylase